MLFVLVLALLVLGFYLASRRGRRQLARSLAPVITFADQREGLAFTGLDFDVMRCWQDEAFAAAWGVGLAIDWEGTAAPEILKISAPSFDTSHGWTRVEVCCVIRERDAIVVADAGGVERGRFDSVRAALDYLAGNLTAWGGVRPKLPPRGPLLGALPRTPR